MEHARSYRRLCVLGGGSFGTALAHLASSQGQEVRLWLRDPQVADAIARQRRNPRYLPDVELHRGLIATTHLGEAIAGSDWLLVAVPSQQVRAVLTQAAPHVSDVPVVLGAKGLEVGTLSTMAEVARDVLAGRSEKVLALSGPCFAVEAAQHKPTAVVMASEDERLAEQLGRLLFCEHFRVYSSADVVGVEMGGALKNVIAIAAGAVGGRALGDNALAALITRGLAEMTRMAVAKGANPLTMLGLAGVGDLVLTCTSPLSRNRSFGHALARGQSRESAQREAGRVVEGIETAASAHALAQRLGVEAPITRAVYDVLHRGLPAGEVILNLLRREPRSELEY